MWRCCLLAAVVLVSAAPAHASDDAHIKPDDVYIRPDPSPFQRFHSKSYALVIGIGDYDAVTKLDAPAKDALRVRKFLKDEAGFDYIVTLTDAAATQARIVKLMETIFPPLLHENDRFLFYFSGHGRTRPLPSGPRGYLLLKWSRENNFDEMIGMPDIKKWAENVGTARHVLFVLDACSSGLAAVESKTVESRAQEIRSLDQPSSHLLTAGVDDERSYAEKGASFFTEAFLASASGKFNPPQDSIVSLSDMMSGIRRWLALNLAPGLKMTPHLTYFPRPDGNPGEFFFLLNKANVAIGPVPGPSQQTVAQ